MALKNTSDNSKLTSGSKIEKGNSSAISSEETASDGTVSGRFKKFLTSTEFLIAFFLSLITSIVIWLLGATLISMVTGDGTIEELFFEETNGVYGWTILLIIFLALFILFFLSEKYGLFGKKPKKDGI